MSSIKKFDTILDIAGSSNGRTWAFGAQYLGSNPSPAAKKDEFEMNITFSNLRRFIKTPILIGVVLLLALGVTGYFGIKQYQNYQTEKVEKEMIAQEVQRQNDLEVEKLKQEIETLKSKELQIIRDTIIKEAPTPKTENDLSSIIQYWEPRVAFIRCYFYYTDGGLSHIQSGSGIALYDTQKQKVAVVTNRHVVTAEDQWTPDDCTMQFPGVDSNLYHIDAANGIGVGTKRNPSLDVAYVWFSSPSEILKIYYC